MLKEYSNRTVTDIGGKLIERYDLHYQDYSSDKVYICTLQEREDVVNGVKKTVYEAVVYYGRRGNSLSRNHLGAFFELASAHKEMIKQMNTKTKKGYKEVGHYVDPDAKATASGALGSKVLELLRETYPANQFVLSPSGEKRRILNITDKGALVILNGPEAHDTLEIPFGKYGMLKVVQ